MHEVYGELTVDWSTVSQWAHHFCVDSPPIEKAIKYLFLGIKYCFLAYEMQ